MHGKLCRRCYNGCDMGLKSSDTANRRNLHAIVRPMPKAIPDNPARTIGRLFLSSSWFLPLDATQSAVRSYATVCRLAVGLWCTQVFCCLLFFFSEAVRGDPCKSNGGCSENAWCVPVPGGRACRCKLGFVGNGISCTPVSKSQCRLYV